MLRWTTVGPTVWLLGLTSLFTDVSSEMITSTLPLYAMFSLQLSPAAFGLIDGLQQGGASLMRLAGGVVTDRWRRHKEVAALGYVASAACRLGLLLVGRNPIALTGLTLVDRLGKGLRTSPRDAMISLSSPRAGLAAAFGVHRMLDTLGAMLGPVVAFAVLARFPGGYDVVFVVSFVVALVGVAILVAFVRSPHLPAPSGTPPHLPAPSRTSPPRLASLDRELRWAGPHSSILRDHRVRTLALNVGALGAATLSDSFIYLMLQRRLDFNPTYLPLLYVATPAVYMLLAAPVGWAADRVGRGVIVIGGYLALLAVYAMILLSMTGVETLIVCVLLLGLYYAATDGVVPALASVLVPAPVRATGLSIVGSANDVGRIVSGLLFGWLWSVAGMDAAMLVFAAALSVGLVIAGPSFRRLQTEVEAEARRP